MLARLLNRRPNIDAALSALDKHRLKLPVLSLQKLFADFNEKPVRFDYVPVGPWSSPIADVALLMKVVVCARPKRVLEVGSYRGYTALMLAQHMPSGGTLVTVDKDARHGGAYKDHPVAAMIERRVLTLTPEAFISDKPKSYDLIFLDADHRYDAVRYDTDVLMPLLSDDGYFLWHDYANWGRFSALNGVPEFLHEFAERRPAAAIAGSMLAIHSPSWRAGAGAAAGRHAGSYPRRQPPDPASA